MHFMSPDADESLTRRPTLDTSAPGVPTIEVQSPSKVSVAGGPSSTFLPAQPSTKRPASSEYMSLWKQLQIAVDDDTFLDSYDGTEWIQAFKCSHQKEHGKLWVCDAYLIFVPDSVTQSEHEPISSRSRSLKESSNFTRRSSNYRSSSKAPTKISKVPPIYNDGDSVAPSSRSSSFEMNRSYSAKTVGGETGSASGKQVNVIPVSAITSIQRSRTMPMLVSPNAISIDFRNTSDDWVFAHTSKLVFSNFHGSKVSEIETVINDTIDTYRVAHARSALSTTSNGFMKQLSTNSQNLFKSFKKESGGSEQFPVEEASIGNSLIPSTPLVRQRSMQDIAESVRNYDNFSSQFDDKNSFAAEAPSLTRPVSISKHGPTYDDLYNPGVRTSTSIRPHLLLPESQMTGTPHTENGRDFDGSLPDSASFQGIRMRREPSIHSTYPEAKDLRTSQSNTHDRPLSQPKLVNPLQLPLPLSVSVLKGASSGPSSSSSTPKSATHNLLYRTRSNERLSGRYAESNLKHKQLYNMARTESDDEYFSQSMQKTTLVGTEGSRYKLDQSSDLGPWRVDYDRLVDVALAAVAGMVLVVVIVDVWVVMRILG